MTTSLGHLAVVDVTERPVGDVSMDLNGYDEATNRTVIVEEPAGDFGPHTWARSSPTPRARTQDRIVWVATGSRQNIEPRSHRAH